MGMVGMVGMNEWVGEWVGMGGYVVCMKNRLIIHQTDGK